MRWHVERGRDGEWYAVTAGRPAGYSTTGPVRVRRRVPVSADADHERAEYVARMMGLLDDGEDEKG